MTKNEKKMFALLNKIIGYLDSGNSINFKSQAHCDICNLIEKIKSEENE